MKKRWNFWDILLYVMYAFIGIGVLIGLFIALRVYVVDQFVIPTDSMRPTLIPGDYVIVNGFTTGWISGRAIGWNATVRKVCAKWNTTIL